MSPYSRGLFPEAADICAGWDFLQAAGSEDLCFLETEDPAPWMSKANKIILFCWNRAYPFDLQFPRKQLFGSWQLVRAEDFPGNSHDRITMEVYEKC